MTTARDYELFGERPCCNACGSELDPETDTRHDGYRGSPHAHNGRGSYGLGSHHYIFSQLCEHCRETRNAPLREILEYNDTWEWLECGHKHSTPHGRWGNVRPGNSRRCGKCRNAHGQDFDPFMFAQGKDLRGWMEKYEAVKNSKRDEVYSCDNH